MTNCDDLQLMFFEVSVVYLSFRAIRKFYFGYKLECNWMQVEHLLCFVSLLITLSTEGKIERKSERESESERNSELRYRCSRIRCSPLWQSPDRILHLARYIRCSGISFADEYNVARTYATARRIAVPSNTCHRI